MGASLINPPVAMPFPFDRWNIIMQVSISKKRVEDKSYKIQNGESKTYTNN